MIRIFFTGMALVLVAFPTWGAVAAAELSPVPMPLESLIPRLKKIHRAKQAKILAQAYRELKAGKYPKARTLCAPFYHDPLYGDHALYIGAMSSYKEALLAYEKDALTETDLLARRARELFEDIPRLFPASPWLKVLPRDLALLELLRGDLAWFKNQWREAEVQFENGFQRLSSGSSLGFIGPDSLRHYGESCSKLRGELCSAWLRRLYLFLPKQCSEMTALLEFAPKLPDQSTKPAGDAKATQSYKAPDLDQDAFDRAMVLILDKKFADAIKALHTFQSEFPKSTFRFRGRFWLAQALRHEGDLIGAKAEETSLAQDSPLTFYGMLATLSLGEPLEAALSAEKPQAVDSDPSLTPLETRRVRRAETLLAEGAKELAGADLKEIRARDPIQASYLMYLTALNHEAGNYATSFSILSELIQRGYGRIFSLPIRDMIFPMPFLNEIRAAAKENDLDPILLLSLVKQESAFDAESASSTGAFGLSQLMYGTAAEVSPDITRALLLEPTPNLKIGARYLHQLLRRTNGNIALALAGYNAGPTAVDRWYKAAPPGRGLLEFIESIPYKETREYVSGIIRNFYWYSRLLEAPAPKGLEYFWTQVRALEPTPLLSPLAAPSAEPSP